MPLLLLLLLLLLCPHQRLYKLCMCWQLHHLPLHMLLLLCPLSST
jgi:hypothetical protein